MKKRLFPLYSYLQRTHNNGNDCEKIAITLQQKKTEADFPLRFFSFSTTKNKPCKRLVFCFFAFLL